ncbi:plastocyanin/azurin family copper-binding protein [Pseudanabaena sp. ABRG5-3]|uniref:plastocyanin/azurin family copper-binding protein n=1 Tax=Pseudanabaena sp. ABRG5-3 TaxID=685565 RepID=UPI000DC73BEB|nr:plastocyanin/azurin family copper-binding protein [Pseudanabaena sp. ABRG5-3]BBC26050.1 copper binding protein, plastocyanin/azurin family [Pseudanabaena sp. ABRG5-3]
MRRTLKILLIGILGILCMVISPNFAIASPVSTTAKLASIDFTKQQAIAVNVSLSNAANELKFTPDRFTFSAGKRYKLLLSNPSGMKHYFTSKDFADAVWTQNVVAGNVEIKGNIRELELKPNATAEWTFVPIKSGIYELHCAIAGHTEAGMRGSITIQPSV